MELKVRQDIVKTDVLVVGGGIGGMQAAIAAAESGASVVVAEKADTRRSGCGSTGNDHFICYIPEYHGDDFNEICREVTESLIGPQQDFDLLRLMMSRSFELVQKWESYGINMRPTGEYIFRGHAMPGRRRYHLKYDGKDQKPLLTKKAKSLGAKLMNKTVMHQLLTNKDGAVIGAIGINIADTEPELIIFQTKVVIIATGNAMRLYPGMNPAYLFNLANCPADAGAGQAMALRAGAKLVNLDLPYVHSGPKYFSRCGKATWIGVLTDFSGKPVGPFVTKPDKELGDVTADIWQNVFEEKMADGSDPVYMNCSETAPEDMDYMMEAFLSEGDSSLVDYMEQYDINLRKEMVEFGTFEYNLTGRGLDINLDGSASIPGLYAAGNVTGNVRGDITSAAVFGQVCGENAAAYAKNVESESVEGHPEIANDIALCSSILERTEGATWKEANSMLQQLMGDYVGIKLHSVRSESLMKAGVKYIRDLRKYALNQMMASNAHELLRALEVFDLIDVGEAIALMSENRKESRGRCHKRSDYTFTNPLLGNKFQTIKKESDGSYTLEFREKRRK